MSSTTEGRKAKERYAVGRALAPHVDEKWAESFVLELRILGVQGSHIGAALSEVESHCSESGQSAQQAFGDPVEYARSLQLPTPGTDSPRAMLRSLAPMMVQILGMMLVNSSFADWLRGRQAEITTGNLVNELLVLLGMVAIVRFADPVMRMIVCHPIRMTLGFMAGTATFVASLLLLDEVIWRVSAGWGLTAGGAALAGGVAWAIVQHRTDGSVTDLITSPFENAGGSSGSDAPVSTDRPPESSRLESLLGAAVKVGMIPAATVLFLAMDLVVHQMGAK